MYSRVTSFTRQFWRSLKVPPQPSQSPSSNFSLYHTLFAISGLYLAYDYHKQFLESCGIVGYIGKEPKAIEVILNGLNEVQNRGYDSAGVATYHENEGMRVTKYASGKDTISDSISKLSKEAAITHKGSRLGIGHTRWATHGGVTDQNAHPHSDHKNRVFVIHNGTISNTHEIEEILKHKGIPIKTETDTELIALLIGMYLDEGHSFRISTKLALERLVGTWGLAAICSESPNEIIVARKGSPILVGIGEHELFVGSEQLAFSKYTNKYIALDDDEIWTLDPVKMEVEKDRIQTVAEISNVSLGHYTHWTLKEIEEQPESAARALNYGARLTQDSARLKGLDEIEDEFLKVRNLLLVGCGTSLHAAQFGAQLIRYMGILNTVQAIDGSELTSYDIPSDHPGVIAISQSGETRDVVGPVEKLVNQGILTLSLVNVVGSQLARLTKHGVYLNSGREIAVASTKSFMNSCIVLAEISLWMSKHLKPNDTEKRKQLVQALLEFPMQVGSVIAQNKEAMKELAEEIKDEQHMFILGRGLGESIAKEGALKIKELSRLHAEGYPGGALKHGPFALIGDGTPIILIILDDENKDMMNLALAEVTGRGAKTIVITPDPSLITASKKPHKIVKIDKTGPLSALLAIIPMQLLGYYLSIKRDLDPDHPRGLAKVVTVS
ncbi:unnamed protein product [Blepharisma stoltei]|uniref:Glutamine--fructose-6-phosphate aminotransferase [isomerizing] n=1 Tax=Blepharisma stoltei TaxID=1481888 RepID=A0AAU9JX91_9CILI|nr:unnamed protein product [Blepharisma stoltei]